MWYKGLWVIISLDMEGFTKNRGSKSLLFMFIPFFLHQHARDLKHNHCCSGYHMSLVMRKPAFCSNCTADQHLCFPYTDSTILYYLNLKFQASNQLLWLYSPVCVGPGRKPEDRFSHNKAHMCIFCAISYSFQRILFQNHLNVASLTVYQRPFM